MDTKYMNYCWFNQHLSNVLLSDYKKADTQYVLALNACVYAILQVFWVAIIRILGYKFISFWTPILIDP